MVIDLITERKPLDTFKADTVITNLSNDLRKNRSNAAVTTTTPAHTNSVDLATKELDRLRAWITEDMGELSASIEAYLTPTEGERTRVHVNHYDAIAGSVQVGEVSVPKVKLSCHLATEQAMIALAAHTKLEAAIKAFAAGPTGAGPRATVAAFLTAQGKLAAAAKALKTAADAANKDHLGALPSGRVALRKLTTSHGDRLELRVIIERTRNGVTTSQQTTFNGRLVQVGVYSKIGGSLIYARADSGPGTAQTWKPNAAASLEWHFRTIYADDAGEKFWNWLDPGFGVHIASLDQLEEEATELGIGLNASIWGGFLQGGIGYNLNVPKDHIYYYFGIDLLKILADTDK